MINRKHGRLRDPLPWARMLYIDSDNAMGAPSGDVDDGFAIAALLRSGLDIAALASVAGNAAERWADRNNAVIGALCGYRGRYLRGKRTRRKETTNQAADFLYGNSSPIRIVALGPLTNIAAAMERSPVVASDLIFVGGNSRSKGRWPPLWPHEFNLTKDRKAALKVFESDLPLTVVPIDIGCRVRARREQLEAITGHLGEYIRASSRRWYLRCAIIKWSSEIAIPDLAAAMYVIEPSLFVTEVIRARMHPNVWLELGSGEREITLVRDFDPPAVWNAFLRVVNTMP